MAASGSAGSLDDIQDALDILNRSGAAYLLLVGRPGETCSRVWSQNRGNTDAETHTLLKQALVDHVDHWWAEPDDT